MFVADPNCGWCARDREVGSCVAVMRVGDIELLYANTKLHHFARRVMRQEPTNKAHVLHGYSIRVRRVKSIVGRQRPAWSSASLSACLSCSASRFSSSTFGGSKRRRRNSRQSCSPMPSIHRPIDQTHILFNNLFV
jgi:hypothetical protein